MTNRYTFEEIKNLKPNDTFWSRGQEFIVSSNPIRISQSDFYGVHSEKVEWDAISKSTKRNVKFNVSNNDVTTTSKPTTIFKTNTFEKLLGSSKLKKNI